MRLSPFFKVLIIIITVCSIVLVVGFISLYVNIKPDNQFIIILRDIIVPIGTLLTLFLLYGTMREYQKTNKINIGKDIYNKHLGIIDNIKLQISVNKMFDDIRKTFKVNEYFEMDFDSVNIITLLLFSGIRMNPEYKDYIVRLNKKDESLFTCTDDTFLRLNNSYKDINQFLNKVSSYCKYFTNVVENIIGDKDFLSEEQYSFLTKKIIECLSGYFTLCEEKETINEVYFIDKKIVDGFESINENNNYFSEIFSPHFDFYYKRLRYMLKKIPIKHTLMMTIEKLE